MEAEPPLEEDTTADVVVVGGGYLGLWTAWQLKALEPSCDVVVLDAGLAGHGPSGRNGGFVSTLWDDLPILRDRIGAERALDVGRPPSGASRGSGSGARKRTSMRGTAPHRPSWSQRARRSSAPRPTRSRPVPRSARRRRYARSAPTSSALAATQLPRRRDPAHVCDGPSARLALGLRAKALEAGVRLHERTPVRRLARRRGRRHGIGARSCVRRRARREQRDGGLPGVPARARRRLEPHRPDRAGTRRDRGARLDGRRADRRRPHAPPLSAHDARRPHRVRLGRRPDGLRRAPLGAAGGRPEGVRTARDDLLRFFPQLRGRRVTHAWGGPIDVSPTHLPIFGSRERVHHGFGFTGNGVGPSYLGGEILARLALDRRDELTRLALVDPDAQADAAGAAPLGGRLADPRRRSSARTAAEDAGGQPDPSRVSSRRCRAASGFVCPAETTSPLSAPGGRMTFSGVSPETPTEPPYG